MIQIKRMYLVNWHYISETTAVFGKQVNFITGDNAAGKSTLLDALLTSLFVHSKDFNLSNQINKSKGTKDARQLLDYMRGTITISTDTSKLALEKGQIYLRPHAVKTWIAVELYDDIQCSYHVVAFNGEINSDSVEDSSIVKHWMWLDGRLDSFPMTVKDSGRKRILSFKEFKALHNDGEYYDTQKAAKLKLSYHYGLTRKPSGDEKAFNHMTSVELKALTFNPQNMKDTDTFLKETIFENDPIDVSSFQHTLQEAKSVKETLAELERQHNDLSQIRESADLFEKAEKEKSIYEIAALLTNRDSLNDALNKAKKQKKEAEEAAKHTQDQIDRINDSMLKVKELRAETEKGSGTDILTAQETALYADLKEAEKAAEKAETAIKYVRTVVAKAKQCDLDCDTAFFENHQTYHLYDGEKEDADHLLKGIRQASRQADDKIREADNSLHTISAELDKLTEEKEGLKTGVSTSENDRKVLQAVKDAYRNLGIDDEPEYLFNKVECTDPSWTQAAEARLGRMLYAIVVKPEHYKEAFHAYRDLARKDKYLSGTVLLNTARLNGIVPRKGSLASVLKADDHNLQNYLCYRYNGTMLVDDATECADDIGSTTYLDRQRMMYSGHNLTRLPAKPSILGHKAKENRLNDILKKEKELLDQASKLTAEKKELVSFLNLAHDDIQYRDLNGDMLTEASRYNDIQDQIKSLEEKKKELLNSTAEEKIRELDSQLEGFRASLAELAEKLKRANMSAGSYQAQTESIKEKLNNLNESIKYKETSPYFKDASLFINSDESRKALSSTEYIKAMKKKSALAEEEMSKQNTLLVSLESRFNAEYGTRFDSDGYGSREKYLNKLTLLEKDRLPDLRSRFDLAEQQAARELNDNVVSGLKARIESANAKIDDLNAIIGARSYASQWYQLNHVKPADGRERYFDAIMNWNTSAVSEDREKKYRETLDDLCANFEQTGQSYSDWYDWRYYCSFSLSVFSSADKGRNGDMGSVIEKGSGAEVQIPWYIVLGTALINAFSANARDSMRKSESLRLMMIDEVFDKMDKNNMQLMIETMSKEMGLQMIVAAPSDRYERFGSTIEQIIYMKTENTNRQCFNFTAEEYDHEIRGIAKQE